MYFPIDISLKSLRHEISLVILYQSALKYSWNYDRSYSGSKEEVEVASTIQPYEGEPRAPNEDFDGDWQRGFLAYGFSGQD